MEKSLLKEEREYMAKFAARFWAEKILDDERFKKRSLTQEDARTVAECWLNEMDDCDFHSHFLKAYISVFDEVIAQAIEKNGANKNTSWIKWK